MISPFLLITGGLLAAWLIFHWLRQAHPRHAAKVLTTLGLGLLVALGVGLVLTGKMAGLAAIVAGLWPWLMRAVNVHALWRALRRDRSGRSPPPSRPDGSMSEEEARAILGVPAGADAAVIKAAHRRLMAANHPDRGGSTWIAARLNQARDRLLG